MQGAGAVLHWGMPIPASTVFLLLGILLAGAAYLLYDRLVCRPRCWQHGNQPDFSSIDPDTWEAYFHVLPNLLETLHRKGIPSPFPETLCAWRLDRFEARLARAGRDELRAGRLLPSDFRRCHRVMTYLIRFAFPHALHQTACITRLRKALDEDRVEAPNRARAREALLEHERRLGILAQVERRAGPALPPGTAEYFYGLMLRWQALFEEHGYPLHRDLASWRKERGELGI